MININLNRIIKSHRDRWVEMRMRSIVDFNSNILLSYENFKFNLIGKT